MTFFVYRATNLINGKVYFGKTSDVARRWQEHLKDTKYGSKLPFHRALRKYGEGGFELTTLAEYKTNEEACAHEVRLIAQVAAGKGYNVASGGDGGVTLTPEQRDAQYGVKPEQYPAFRLLFAQGLTTRAIAEKLGVSFRAVQRAAPRVGVSFGHRRSLKLVSKATTKTYLPRKHKSRAKYSCEEARQRRVQSNINRGITQDQQEKVLELYFSGKSASYVADTLGVSKGAVRGVVNRYNKGLSQEEKLAKRTQKLSLRRLT